MKIEAIVVAAGRGKRLRFKISKPFIEIKKRPILYYTLRVMEKYPLIKNIILVTKKTDIKKALKLIRNGNLKKIKKIIGGGRTRRLSVEEGLKFIDSDTDLVLIHDAVRPFIYKEMLQKIILTAERFGAAVLGVPLKSTIKSVKKNLFVKETLNRSKIWEIQTPQVFKRDLLFNAYKKFKGDFLDDSQVVEKLGVKVKVIRGDYFNIKITTPEDLVFARAILSKIKNKI